MRISFNPPRARIVAVVIAAWMIWHFIEKHVREISVDIHVQRFDQNYALAIAALVIIAVVALVVNFWSK